MVRGFYAWVGSVAIAAVTPFFAVRLIESETMFGRIAGVVLGVLLWVPMIVVTTIVIRNGDEFERRIHFVAIATAFAGALLLISALDWLVRARFMEPPELSVVWLAIAALWFVAMIGAKRYYARQ
jgi:hypothetical protein